ncbi:immunoglobulin alpha-2 heavy chain-like [Mauremys mutica]|uniref:immunoglobulin alpha-2 heavy chain-like n=1 Tax=Mauremys mutica TaxID=74926 RepID=UPI001D16831F|nr:immunoglobulin alpha-2 heavy chain-like [Mauremys mutica]
MTTAPVIPLVWGGGTQPSIRDPNLQPSVSDIQAQLKPVRMLLVQVLIVASIWSYGAAQVQLTQDQLSITRKPTKTVRIDCKVSGISIGDAFIHWYRQRPGEAPEWILYFKTQTDKSNFDKEKFSVDKTNEKSTCTLTVDKLTYNDMATYYCACWDRTVLESHRQTVQKPHSVQLKIWPMSFCKAHEHSENNDIKVFGSGTKLIVSSTPARLNDTMIQVLPPFTEQDGKVSYMCFIKDFHPNVIKVTWEDQNKNEEKNGVHEEIWPPDDNQQSYSLSSWLTIDKNSSKNYSCKYQHEIKGGFVPTKSPDKPVASQTTGGCSQKPENGTTVSTDITDSFIHRTASLIYIVLLLKSTMYYVIVLFFIYRMQRPIKRRGKKP